MIKQAVAALSLLCCLLALPGCWSRTEVNDLAIVSMLAIDQAEGGELELWVQVVVPGPVGGSSGMPEGPGQSGRRPFVVMRATGRTILEASKRIQLELPRRLLWSHVRVALIGERLASRSVRPAVDFLTRHRELRLTNYIMLVRGDLAEFMATTVDLETLPAEYLREIAKSRLGLVIGTSDWVRMLARDGGDPVLGAVEVVPPFEGAPPGQGATLKLVGTALFKGDQLVGYLDEWSTRGLLWLRNEVQQSVVTAETPMGEGFLSMEWVSSRARRVVQLENGKIVLYVVARTEGSVSEDTVGLDLSDPDMVREVEEQAAMEIQHRIITAVEELREHNVDAVALGEIVHRQLPGVWKQLRETWLDEGFRKVKVVVEVDARVRRTGMSHRPRGVRDEDVIEKGR